MCGTSHIPESLPLTSLSYPVLRSWSSARRRRIALSQQPYLGLSGLACKGRARSSSCHTPLDTCTEIPYNQPNLLYLLGWREHVGRRILTSPGKSTGVTICNLALLEPV